MDSVRMTRRSFVHTVGLSTAIAMATACAGAPAPTEVPEAPATPTEAPEAVPAPTEPPTETVAPALKYQEALSLTEKVAARELPPVDERLPLEPLVVEPFDEAGEYCGDMKMVLATTSGGGLYSICWEGFTRFDYRDGHLKIVPNVAKSWDVSADNSTYTFHLREGVRWSDGEPFTADDVMFWYEDIALNEELGPVFPGWLTLAGEVATIEKIDDYTVRFSWSKPNALFLERMSFNGESAPPFAPAHYLKQFHPKYADADELAQEVDAAGFDHWYEYFANRNDERANAERPTLGAWKPDVGWGPVERMTATRNPYYWKVDTNGKQLPYFERVVVKVVQDNEVALMNVIAGESDFQTENIGFANIPLLKEHEEDGHYRIVTWWGGYPQSIYVNQSYQHPTKHELFRNRKFRHALSYAINRDELNDLFWMGMAEKKHACGSPDEPYWQEGFGQTAIEYDPDKANAMLDEIGLDQRDGNGFRLDAEGNRLQVLLEFFGSDPTGVERADLFDQVATYWKEVGIDAVAKSLERSLWQQRATNNEAGMPCYSVAELLWVINPVWYVPVRQTCYWAPAYGLWYATGGEGGLEPPDDIKEIQDWYDQLQTAPNEETRIEMGRKILARHNEEVYHIGTCHLDIYPVVVHKDMVNVLEKGIADWRVHRAALAWAFQLWKREA